MNIAVVNAYILWKASNRPLPGNKRQHGLKFFKAELVLNLCDPAIAMRSRRVAPPTQQPEALYTVQTNVVVGHAHVRFDGRKRVCQSCQRQGQQMTSGRSVGCNVHVYARKAVASHTTTDKNICGLCCMLWYAWHVFYMFIWQFHWAAQEMVRIQNFVLQEVIVRIAEKFKLPAVFHDHPEAFLPSLNKKHLQGVAMPVIHTVWFIISLNLSLNLSLRRLKVLVHV